MKIAVQYALCAILYLPLVALAADDVTERAVPVVPSPLQKQVPIQGTAMTATPMEQQLAALQQQVQALQAQLAMIQAAVVVTSNGVTLQGPSVTLSGGAINLRTQNTVDVKARAISMRADMDVNVKAGNNASLDASSNLTIKSGAGTVVQAMAPLDLYGSLIRLNGGTNTATKPLALLGSQVQVSGSTGQVVNGSATILGN